MSINKQLFSLAFIGMMAAVPVIAAESAGPADLPAKTVASKNLDCADGACHRRGGMSLSDEQLEKMGALRNKFLDSTSAQRTELESAMRQLKDVFTKSEIDRQKALEIQSRINTLKSDLANARLNFKLESLNVLTAEQREKIRHRMLLSEAFGGRGFAGAHHGKFRHARPMHGPKPGGPAAPASPKQTKA